VKKRTTTVYNVHEAKTHLSHLLERVAAGEEVIIAKAGVPVARLVPVVLPSEGRQLGTEKGRLVIGEDFDSPLPDDVLSLFEP
jgi:prevent-host-death family protein